MRLRLDDDLGDEVAGRSRPRARRASRRPTGASRRASTSSARRVALDDASVWRFSASSGIFARAEPGTSKTCPKTWLNFTRSVGIPRAAVLAGLERAEERRRRRAGACGARRRCASTPSRTRPPSFDETRRRRRRASRRRGLAEARTGRRRARRRRPARGAWQRDAVERPGEARPPGRARRPSAARSRGVPAPDRERARRAAAGRGSSRRAASRAPRGARRRPTSSSTASSRSSIRRSSPSGLLEEAAERPRPERRAGPVEDARGACPSAPPSRSERKSSRCPCGHGVDDEAVARGFAS